MLWLSDTSTIRLTFISGPSNQYTVQRRILRHHSPYFRKLLDANGTSDQTIDRLECLDAEHLNSSQPFELFLQYLYQGVIDEVPPKDQHARHNVFTYIRLWVLCDASRFDMPALQALALQRIVDYQKARDVGFNAPQAKYIYDNTKPGALLRNLVAEEAARDFVEGNGTSVEGLYGVSPVDYVTEDKDFAVDVLQSVKRSLATARNRSRSGSSTSVLDTRPSIEQMQPTTPDLRSPSLSTNEMHSRSGSLASPFTPQRPPQTSPRTPIHQDRGVPMLQTSPMTPSGSIGNATPELILDRSPLPYLLPGRRVLSNPVSPYRHEAVTPQPVTVGTLTSRKSSSSAEGQQSMSDIPRILEFDQDDNSRGLGVHAEDSDDIF